MPAEVFVCDWEEKEGLEMMSELALERSPKPNGESPSEAEEKQETVTRMRWGMWYKEQEMG